MPRKCKPQWDRAGDGKQSGKKNGYIFVGLSEVFYGRAFTSGRDIPSLTRNGREATINNSENEARDTTLRCRVGLQMDPHCFSLLERSSGL